MQRATRNYAKRQLTWFRREPGAEWVKVHGWDWVAPLAEQIAARLAHRDFQGEFRMTKVE
jgi:tRNA A37 N6-isopentenylltransferase MiaA